MRTKRTPPPPVTLSRVRPRGWPEFVVRWGERYYATNVTHGARRWYATDDGRWSVWCNRRGEVVGNG